MSYIQFTKRNIRRSPYQALTAIMVMFLTFLSISIFLILAAGSENILKFYESKPQAIVFFQDTAQDSDIKAIENALQQTGKVTSLKYISKDEALQIYKERNKNNPTLLELVTASILPASLEVSTQNPQDLAPIVEVLRKEPVVEDVVYPEDVVKSLNKATTVVRIVGSSAVIFLLIFSLLVILMVIGFKIRIRRSEVEIMKLLGASHWFIRSPFLMEGVLYGIIGATLAWTTSYILLWYFSPFLQNMLEEIKLFPVSPIFMLELLAIELLLAFIIGVTGSYGALRRYLKL